ncbi:MAG: ribokinase [Planctomycetota bacterium]|jgi:ribokinase|nr:MAG: ribokinase [Planctomycetota bacterium]GDY07868.1 ribokinase [Planctomycetia bacterium]
MSIIVLGSINTDLVIRSPALPRPGETVLGGEFYRAAGGKGANQAVAAARSSREPVTFLAAVGDDSFGHESLAGLQRENLDTRFLKLVPDQPSGVALILVDAGGQNLISVASGANLHLRPDDIHAVPVEVWQNARVFVACLESPLETVMAGLRRAKQNGLTTIINPAPADREILFAVGLRLIDIFTPNETEAALLTGREVRSDDEAEAAARQLQLAGCSRIIITRGEHGCCVLDGDTVTHLPAKQVDSVDAVAAGDVFNGALATALAEGRTLLDAARWAGAAAAISVTRRGAQPSIPTRDEIDT